MATSPHWEHFAHQADIGVRGIGPSLEDAFRQAALALTAIITDPTMVQPLIGIPIECAAPDPELLLVDWLNALISESGIRKMLWSRFDLQLDGNRLMATVWGEKADPKRHRPTVEVKGATYTALSVKQEPSGTWVAQCVVDV